ncbi:52 kDa repressor of the inhibitor of the protein kinase-like [Aphis gossypii]|uniref:52 kDa repressor of the inhibitor of the protein kinase-like n=1 Tax=Aphis gossypii TaxID=80765 RepID=UPI002158C174|nr:52 kDa repressor of the inhibitor of the protein kinase-like [Aphis gossypii]
MLSNKKRVGQTNSITSWVKRVKTDSNESSETENTSILAGDLPILKSADVKVTCTSMSSTITSCAIRDTTLSTDIGNFLPGTCPSDIIKANIHTKKGKQEKRFLKRTHFEQFNWLHYSTAKGGLFCKYCVLFADKGGKDKNVTLNKFVNFPLNKYAKILGVDGDFQSHSRHLYHKNAMQVPIDFLDRYKNPQKEIINLMSTQRMQQITENRERLRPIIECIIFLGRQNLAFRGHRDQGKLNTNIDLLPTNESNFRQLLKFIIASGDKVLEKHLQTTSAKATYISHTTQEQLIECCKEEILSHILNNVKESCYYSIIFDETTDISHISQLSLSLRCVDKVNNVHEQFIGFINCHDYVYDKLTENNVEPKLTGIVLGNAVVSIMKDMSLDLNNCVGIGTDGCSVMTSVTRGAVAEIQKTCPNAVYSPCSNHALNLSISKSSNVQLVRNSMGIIKEVLSFFNTSSKRSFVLKNCLKGSKRSITGLCETRWVERHECIFEFQLCLSEIIDSLTYISE